MFIYSASTLSLIHVHETEMSYKDNEQWSVFDLNVFNHIFKLLFREHVVFLLLFCHCSHLQNKATFIKKIDLDN